MINFLYRMSSTLCKLTIFFRLLCNFLLYIYFTSYVPFCSHHPPPLPVETLSSCPTALPFRTVVPGTAPPSSLPSSSTTVSPGEGKTLILMYKRQNHIVLDFSPVGVNICMHFNSTLNWVHYLNWWIKEYQIAGYFLGGVKCGNFKKQK